MAILAKSIKFTNNFKYLLSNGATTADVLDLVFSYRYDIGRRVARINFVTLEANFLHFVRNLCGFRRDDGCAGRVQSHQQRK